MAYYYIPLLTRDFTFENIFATESISPPSFYSLRSFGIGYFKPVKNLEPENVLILYNAIPKFQTEGSGNGIRYVLAIDSNEIITEDIIMVDEGIIAVHHTIYLRHNNFRIIFFSEPDMKLMIAKSAGSLPTKSVTRYLQNFEVINQPEDFYFAAKNIPALDINARETEQQILADRKYNSFKGFIYGISCGIYQENKPAEAKLKSSIQQIINSGAAFRNRLENSSRLPESRYSRAGNDLLTYQDKVIEAIERAEQILLSVFPEYNIPEIELSELLLHRYKQRLRSLEHATDFINNTLLSDELFGTNNYAILKKRLLEQTNAASPVFLFHQLKEIYTNAYTDSKREERERRLVYADTDTIKNILFKLNTLIEKKALNDTNKTIINLGGIHYNSALLEITIEEPYPVTEPGIDYKEYALICTIILKNSKLYKGDTSKADLLKMVDAVGNEFTRKGNIRESPLYQYLNNAIDTYSIEKVPSLVMKNFVAFVFNPDSLEKLEKFLVAKEITSKWIAFSFWCAFNGFANTSGNFLGALFNVQNHPMQDYLDDYLQTIRKNIKDNNKGSSNSDTLSLSRQQLLTVDMDLKIEHFFKNFMKGKFSISANDFKDVLQKQNKDERVNLLKTNYNIDMRNAKKIMDAYTAFMDGPSLF